MERWGIIAIAILILYLVILASRREGFQNSLSLRYIEHYIPRTAATDPIVNGVPLNIFQSWHTHDLPPKMYDTVIKLIQENPEFNYYLYDDAESLRFIQQYFPPDVTEAFNSLRPGAFKSDLWRYCVLYINGGVYLDIKYVLNVSLLSIIKQHSTVFVIDTYPHNQCGGDELEGIYNGFMISPPKNPIFKECIDEIVRACKAKDYKRTVLDITGPCLLGSVLKANKTINFYYQNPFRFSHHPQEHIRMNNKMIMYHYPDYRNEQRQYQKTQHYHQMYLDRDVFN